MDLLSRLPHQSRHGDARWRMDGSRFDELTRTLATPTSRRRTLRLLSGGTLALLAAALGAGDARATHHGCRHVGRPCTRDGECCSSRCRGSTGKQTCRSHNTRGCAVGPPDQFCFVAQCGSDLSCGCTNTTGRSGYCSDGSVSCYDPPCTTDRQCERLTGIVGAACIECATCAGGTGCSTPCSS